MILLLKLVLDLHIHLLSTKKVKFTPGDKEISYNSVTVIKTTLKLLKKLKGSLIKKSSVFLAPVAKNTHIAWPQPHKEPSTHGAQAIKAN